MGNATSLGAGSTSIYANGGQNVLVVGNRVVARDTGVFVSGANPSLKCRDNFFTSIVTSLFSTCTDAGNNN